jgi:undecaprenyl diphosphate synthase
MFTKTKRKKYLNSKAFTEAISSDSNIERLPTHIAIIMDGNGRWARKRSLNRIKGHEKGAQTVRSIVRTCREMGIRYLTLYAFSTENWLRPRAEVSALMHLLKKFLISEEKELIEKNIRLNVIGQIEQLSPDIQEMLRRIMSATQSNDQLMLTLALSYGGRAEILKMVRELAQEVQNGSLQPDEISDQLIAEHLYTQGIPDPDMLIRTSGEMRISNFLLWQIAYTEIFVTKTLWPDFNKEEFLDILREYQSRERRYGKV